MLNKNGQRELAYVVAIDDITSIKGKDRVESAHVGGWQIMVRKGLYNLGDLAVYFEIDSKLPDNDDRFNFLEKYHYRIKTQKFKDYYSQGLLMSAEELGGEKIEVNKKPALKINDKLFFQGDFLTEELGVTHYQPDAPVRHLSSEDKYKKMARRHPKVFSNPLVRKIYKTEIGKRILFAFFGRDFKKPTSFPTQFPYIHKTDQERCENIPWVLKDKTPFIVTQKCDGSSGTFILERTKNPFKKYEFYVCSRNVRQLDEKQQCFYDENYYWAVAKKYNIEEKLTDYMNKHPELTYVCWQGEICGPGIQKNPHGLTSLHLFCFHMIDSEIGKYDIRKAKTIWDEYKMKTVPILGEIVLPDSFEEFKLQADGYYDPSVCEGKEHQHREGFVYYKTSDPNFSFKNVSRKYLASKG